MTIAHARARLRFPLLAPDGRDERWELSCLLVEESEHPPLAAHVFLHLVSRDGGIDVEIAQVASDELARHHYATMVDDGCWERHAVGPVAISARPEHFGQGQAYLERDGTFAFLVADDLANAELVRIAADLRPAPGPGPGPPA